MSAFGLSHCWYTRHLSTPPLRVSTFTDIAWYMLSGTPSWRSSVTKFSLCNSQTTPHTTESFDSTIVADAPRHRLEYPLKSSLKSCTKRYTGCTGSALSNHTCTRDNMAHTRICRYTEQLAEHTSLSVTWDYLYVTDVSHNSGRII